jgi:hypothetical protein
MFGWTCRESHPGPQRLHWEGITTILIFYYLLRDLSREIGHTSGAIQLLQSPARFFRCVGADPDTTFFRARTGFSNDSFPKFHRPRPVAFLGGFLTTGLAAPTGFVLELSARASGCCAACFLAKAALMVSVNSIISSLVIIYQLIRIFSDMRRQRSVWD